MHKVRLENKAQVSESHRGQTALTAIRADTVSTVIDVGFFLVSISIRTDQCSFVVFIAVRSGSSQSCSIACGACLAFCSQ
ncbi:hypothetical protein E0D78_004955 [Escherichia coli]|nr:hypothetical protein [Escherichia coli]